MMINQKEVWSALRTRGTFAILAIALDHDVRRYQFYKLEELPIKSIFYFPPIFNIPRHLVYL